MRIWIILALTVTLCAPAFAQYALVKGSDSQTETILGLYPSQDPSGNQAWVREYDGREFFKGIGIEKVDSYGYSGLYQYSFLARDLIINDEDIGFNGTYGNSVGINLVTSAMLHRLAAYPGANPELVGTPAAGGDPQVNRAGNTEFFVNRRVNDFSIRSTPTQSRGLRLVLGNWEQTKTGTMQVLSRFVLPGSPPGTASVKSSSAIPNDNNTSATYMGFDAALCDASVLNYRNVETKFGQYAGRGVAGTINDIVPLNQLTVVRSTTPAQAFKLRTKINDRMHFTGMQTYKSRSDAAAHFSVARVSVASTNAALTMLAGDATTITASYRRYNLGDGTSILRRATGVPTNHTLSQDQRSYLLEATYTGLPRTFLKANYERQNNNYSGSDSTIPWTSTTTKWNILRAGVRTCLTSSLNLQANYENWNDTTATFSGTANKRTKFDVNGTYLLTDSIGLYGNYNQSEQSNDQIRVSAIPTPANAAATTPTTTELREEAAGQNPNGKFATTVIGAWYALNEKLTFDLNWSRISMNSQTTWILGISGANQQPPDYVPFEATDDQWTVGATYVLNPIWRLRGSYFSSNSDGQSTIALSAPLAALGPIWSPIRVSQQAWTLGVSRNLSMKDTLDLDLTTEFFHDEINSANSGTFGLWRLAWTRSY